MIRSRTAASLGLQLALMLPPLGAQVPVPVGSEFQVNTYTTGIQAVPDVELESDGDFVMVWGSDQDGSERGVERDLARAQRVEYRGMEPGEPQTALDMADGEPEPAGNPFYIGTLLDQRAEREALVGRVHREPLEVLGKRSL